MQVKLFHSSLEIPEKNWKSLEPNNFPFASYSFLSSLESSQSLGKRTGWYPLIFTVWDNKSLIAASVLYLRTNSYGEYIFDWAWAEAWQRYGLSYYPKLTAAVPFTPATGPKILCNENSDKEGISTLILDEVKTFMEKEKASTIHFLFISEDEISLFKKAGYEIRKSYQFHWKNRDYSDFNDFLMALKQKKRKEIRRERKLLLSENLKIKQIKEDDIPDYADFMYELYLSTIDKKWSSDYLTKEFFTQVFNSMKNEIVLFVAFKNDSPIAATLNFHKGDTLFGRYWGCIEEIPNLHFELCYYLPIEYCIKNKLRLFEAGAQGEHKIQRGFIPSYTYSAHFIPKHELGEAVKSYIHREASQIDRLIDQGPSMAYK
ncbi:MAG: GNAT family N-acetyltransferase [Lentisphaeraceae bacterium]|nr:GNAT family N-acetyltransferase [Lentisphaeraceae bacterium]